MNDTPGQLPEIKYISICRVNDSQMLLSLPCDKSKKAYADEYRKEAQDIANNLREQQAYANLRDMTESIYGTWYTTCDENLISYSVLTDPEFKSYMAYQFLTQLSHEIYKEVPRFESDHNHINSLQQTRDAVLLLVNNHHDSKKTDKLSQAQEKVDQVRLIMQSNVKQMIENQSDFTDMESKSSSIKDTAFTMKNNAKQLEREARKRNCRLWAIIICIVISILIYIIVPLAVKAKRKSQA